LELAVVPWQRKIVADEEYLREIRKYKTHKKLYGLWEQILHGSTAGWADGKALEYLVLRTFEIECAQKCGGRLVWNWTPNW
jgi:hypothetical protein